MHKSIKAQRILWTWVFSSFSNDHSLYPPCHTDIPIGSRLCTLKHPLSHCHALRCYNQPGQPSTVQAHWEAAGSAASLFSTGAAVHRVGERTTCPCWAVTNISIFGQPAWDTLIDGVDHDSWWKHPDSRFDSLTNSARWSYEGRIYKYKIPESQISR